MDLLSERLSAGSHSCSENDSTPPSRQWEMNKVLPRGRRSCRRHNITAPETLPHPTTEHPAGLRSPTRLDCSLGHVRSESFHRIEANELRSTEPTLPFATKSDWTRARHGTHQPRDIYQGTAGSRNGLFRPSEMNRVSAVAHAGGDRFLEWPTNLMSMASMDLTEYESAVHPSGSLANAHPTVRAELEQLDLDWEEAQCSGWRFVEGNSVRPRKVSPSKGDSGLFCALSSRDIKHLVDGFARRILHGDDSSDEDV